MSSFDLMIVTKGDTFEQEAKISRSGLGAYFQHVEIVSQKTSDHYARILESHSVEPLRFMMVGNSLRSDILPILELGGHAVYIPCDATWLHEAAELPPSGHPGFHQVEHVGELIPLLERIEGKED